jgi:microcystin-dependent protein
MSEPFLAEVKMVSFNFPPKGWAFCNGQLLPINQNQALFALLGTTYGGNGQTTFALPDLQGRTPIHWNNDFPLGAVGGEEAHTLTTAELAAHTHTVQAVGAAGNNASPTGRKLAQPPMGLGNTFGPAGSAVALDTGSLTVTGGGQAHTNLMPYLTVNFVIALQGIFPSRN